MLRLGLISALLLYAGLCLGQGIDAPESQAEADAKSSAQDQVSNEALKKQLDQGLVSREAFLKQVDYHAGWIARRRAKWASTPYLAIYDKAYKRALTDSAYRRPLPTDPPAQVQPEQESQGHSLFAWVAIAAICVPILAWLYLRRAGEKTKKTIKRAAVAVAVLLGLVGMYLVLTSDLPIISEFRENPLGVSLGLLAVAAYLVLAWKAGNMKEPPPPVPQLPPLSTTFGSASYVPEITTLNDGGEGLASGVFFGKSSHPEDFTGKGVPIFSRSESHTLIIAKTRTGKGTRVLCPTLLRASKTSAFVFDPAGENASITARARAMTNHVHIMDPWSALGDTFERLGFLPATFNPLDMLDPRDPNVVSIAQAMGRSLSPEGQSKEPFWASMAANLIAALFLWLVQQPGETKTLRRVSDILSRDRKSFTKDFVTQLAACQGPKTYDGAVRKWSAPFLDMPDVTWGGIMGHVADAVAFLADPQILAATSTSSFSMRDLTGAGKDRPTTLYLVCPPTKVKIQKTWLRLMITAAMDVFRNKPPGSRYRCMFMIDELPALGLIEDLSTEVATAAKTGVDFVLVAQSFSKLRSIYHETTDDIIGNCSYKWFCNVNDNETAEYLSKTLGNRTVRTTNRGENKGSSYSSGPNANSSNSEGENISYGETGAPLLRPEDAQTLGSDIAILLAPNSRPHYLRPIDYWNLQE